MRRVIEQEDTSIMQIMLDHGVSAYGKPRAFVTPILWAACLGRVEMVKFFIKNGADINWREGLILQSVFDASRVPLKMLKFLIDNGADLKTSDALTRACIYRFDVEATRMLLDAGADPRSVAEHFIRKYSDQPSVQLLLRRMGRQ